LEVGISAAPSLAHDLYERYSGQIFGFCVNRLGSREEAEDALQSTFLNAHRALQRGVTPDAELPWLFKIAHNVCLTRRRSTRRRGRVETPSDFESVQDVVPAPPREAPDELIELTGALSEMPDNQRRAILLREWQGLSYHEIANELELSPSAVETLIFRARRTLAANLESRPGLLARARQALDLGGLVTAASTLFEGAVALKATAAAVAVSGAVVVATAPSESSRPAVVPKADAKVVRAPAQTTARKTVEHSPPAAVATETPRPTRAAARTPVVAARPGAQSPAEQPPAAAVVPNVTAPVAQTPPESIPSPAPEPTPAASAPTAGSDPTPVAAEPAQRLRHQRPDTQQPDPIAAAPAAPTAPTNPGVVPSPSG
jgi:RNA polymerase sigma factor (sigma-70 family)